MATISDVQYSQNETVTNPCIHLNPPPWRQKLWRTRRYWQRGRQRREHKPRTSTELLGRNRLIFSFLICFSINLSITTVITPRDTCFFFATWKSMFFLDLHFFDTFGVPSLMEAICHQLRMTGANLRNRLSMLGPTRAWSRQRRRRRRRRRMRRRMRRKHQSDLPNGKCLSWFSWLDVV